MPAHRSYMFTPGNHPRRVEKVFTLDADAVILDLEDAVALSEKEATRATVVEALRKPRSVRAYVRVNDLATPFCFNDFVAVTGPWLDGIMLPKVETPAQIETADWLLGNLERTQGMAAGSVDLLPIVETGRGLANARAIAAARPRVKRLSFGAADFCKDMGMRWTAEEAELTPARAEIVLASRVAGIEPPLDSVWIAIKDTDGLVASARRVKDLGFQGKLCIHPDQIGTVNDVFTPTEAEAAFAEKVVAAFETAEAAGEAAIQVEGRMIDYPVVEEARRTLATLAAIRAG
jgi:citrate lyase subunit beta / citryl-CoA lyase